MIEFLSNNWFHMVMRDYSMLVGLITTVLPMVTGAILKTIAILNPNVTTNTIRELLTWKTKARGSKEDLNDGRLQ